MYASSIGSPASVRGARRALPERFASGVARARGRNKAAEKDLIVRVKELGKFMKKESDERGLVIYGVDKGG